MAAWKKPPYTDHCLVGLIAYGAFTAVDRIERALPLDTSAPVSASATATATATAQ